MLRGDQLTHAVRFGVRQGRLARDGDLLRHRAYRQFEVHALRVADRQLDMGVQERLEALGLRLQRVERRLEVGYNVKAKSQLWRPAMRISLLCASGFFICSLLSGLELPQSSHPVPLGVREADKLPDPADIPPEVKPQRKPVNPAQLKREAEELAKLAESIPTEIDRVAGGQLPKDLDEQLKQIEKLSKRLRREISP